MVTDAQDEIEVPEVPDGEVEEEQLTETELEAGESADADAGAHSDELEPVGDVERITELVPMSWGGVKSCDHSDVIARKIQAGVENWVAKKLFENKHMRYINHGHEPAVVRTRKRKSWDGKRSCRSWVNVPCWIRFAPK